MSFFKKLSDFFESDLSKFNNSDKAYLAKKAQELATIDLSFFPDNFSGSAKIIDDSCPLHRLLEYNTINIPELIHYCAIYGFAFRESNEDYYKNINFKTLSRILAKNPNINITPEEFNKIISDSTIYMFAASKLMDFPRPNTLFLDDPKQVITIKDKGFHDFYLLMGFCSMIGFPVIGKCGKIINSFLINQGSTILKTFDDISDPQIQKNVYDKVIQMKIIEASEINYLHNIILNQTVSDLDNYNFTNTVDWLKFALIASGQTNESAITKINGLKQELDSLAEDWAAIAKVLMLFQELNTFNWESRVHIITEFTPELIGNIFYKPITNA